MLSHVKLPVWVLWVFLLSQSLCAADFNTGDAAYKRGDYLQASQIWKPLAEAGNSRAQFALGSLYDEGLGVEQNFIASSYWFERAAEQGLAIAQFNLGVAYKFGRGMSPDVNKALHWWLKAAEQGLVSAQFNLGMQYYLGEEIEPDELQGARWLQLAADNGHQQARQFLGQSSAGEEPVAQIENLAPVTGQSSTEQHDSVVGISSLADVRGPEWLRAQRPDHYTIQLIALNDMESIRRFIDNNQLRGQLAVFSLNRADRALFVLVAGSFPDRSSAEVEILNLPKPVRQGQPWLRSIGDIQQLLPAGDKTS